MNKTLLKTVVCFCLCVASLIAAFICYTNKSFAVEHYKNTPRLEESGGYYGGDGYSIADLEGKNKYYGCGKESCKYCNFGERKNYEDFVYYRTMTTVTIIFIVVAVAGGFAGIIGIGRFVNDKKEEHKKSEE